MRVLVCGGGSIGTRHIGLLAKHFSQDVFAFEPAPAVRQRIEEETGITVIAEEDEAFRREPDLVLAAGPTSTHLITAKKALAAGAHVFIEKPISHNLDGVEEMLEEAENLNLTVSVGSNMRFYPCIRVLKENLSHVGNIRFSRARVGYYLPYMRPGVDYRTVYAAKKSSGGGVILDDIHEIDYHLWYFGGVESLFCRSATLGTLEIDVEDYAVINLHFCSGIASEIQLDYLNRCRSRGCEIVGDQGTLLWEERGKPFSHRSVRIYTDETGEWNTLYDDSDSPIDECYTAQLAELLDVAEGKPRIKLASGREGLAALKIALACKHSAKNDSLIRF